MTDDDANSLVARADELDERINAAGLHEQIAHLTDYGLRNRKLIRLNLVLTTAVIVLCCVVGYLALQVSDNHRLAGEAKVAASAAITANNITCQAANESRSGQRQLWDYIFSTTPTQQTASPEQQARLADFRALIEKIFAPRDCETEAPTTVPPAPSSSP